MICKKFHLDISDICNVNIPDNLKNMDKESFKKEIISIHNCLDDEISRINKHFERLSIKKQDKER